MPIVPLGRSNKFFDTPEPNLFASDYISQKKAKTIYAGAVNLAQNGGELHKKTPSGKKLGTYIGAIKTTNIKNANINSPNTRNSLVYADSYEDLLNVVKGKYLLTPPPSSDLATQFSPIGGQLYYGNFYATDYNLALADSGNLIDLEGVPRKADWINALLPLYPYILVDPRYSLFYGRCNQRDYVKNVTINGNMEIKYDFGTIIGSSKFSNRYRAQEIIKLLSSTLRGFEFPKSINFNLNNCGSKASLSPQSPNAPDLQIAAISGGNVTLSWYETFDGGAPIIKYYVYKNGSLAATITDIKSCENRYTIAGTTGDQFYVVAESQAAVNLLYDETQQYTIFTSPPSNVVVVP